MSSAEPGLVGATPDLERLAVHLAAAGATVSRAALSAARLGHLWDAVLGVRVLDASLLAVVVGAVLRERHARTTPRVELVWTGLEAKTAYARPTAVVVRELFEGAQTHVLMAGYSFDHGSAIFEPLHASMCARGIAVDLYLHLERAPSMRAISNHVAHEVASFFAGNRPFGAPHPTIYIAPRTLDPALQESLHAKCVVVDGRVAVVGSANFTRRGQSRNVEVGARIEEVGFAQAVVGQFRAATNAGVFQRV